VSEGKSRCTGDCCKAFYLSVPYDAMWRSRQAQVRHEKYNVPLPENYVEYEDNAVILSMVKYLGEFKINPVSGHEYAGPTSLYTCKNLAKNGDCKIYETRPAMCREFPDGKPCPYPGCTWRKEDQDAQFAQEQQEREKALDQEREKWLDHLKGPDAMELEDDAD